MTAPTASRVIAREGTATNAPPPAIDTSTTGLVGVTQKGPIGVATLTTSMAEWQNVYGMPTAESLQTWTNADGFFAEGGRFLYTVRVAHLDLAGEPDTAAVATIDIDTSASGPTAGAAVGTPGPWSLPTTGLTFNVDVDAGGPGANATFDFTAAVATSTLNGNGLADGNFIEVAIGQGVFDDIKQIATFSAADFSNIATPTDDELAAVLNDQLIGASVVPDGLGFVSIRTDKKGSGPTTPARIRISAAGASALFGFPADTSGTGNVSDSTAITDAEFTAIVGAVAGAATVGVDLLTGEPFVQSPTTGGSSSIQLGGTAITYFGFDAALYSGSTGAPVPTLTVEGRWEGAYGNDVTVEVADSSGGDADRFNLIVRYKGVRVETWTNLIVDQADARYVVSILGADPGAGSSYVAAIDLAAGLGTPLLDRPANGTYVLAGGDDGLTGLVDSDFTGSSVNKKGFYALDIIKDIRLLVCPGRATSVVQNAMIVYCEVVRDGSAVAILDSPEGLTAVEAKTYFADTAGLTGISEFGIAYWPRVLVLNPDKETFGASDSLVVSPSGRIAGIYGRNDASSSGGVYKPAGGYSYGFFRSIVGLETEETEDPTKRDIVASALVNPISKQSGRRALDGVDVLKANANFPTIGERRGAIFIKLSIVALLEQYRLQNNDATLRAEVNRRISAFLLAQFQNGAFRGATPEESYYVNTDDTLNNDAVVFAYKLLVEVGIATQRPAKFIELTLSQDLRAQQLAESA